MTDDTNVQRPYEARLTEGSEKFLRDHLERVRKRILDEATSTSKESSANAPLEPMAVADAAKVFAPGEQFPPKRRTSLGQRLMEPISGLTLVCAILAVIFGVLGFAKVSNDGLATGFLDIAKVFAGAVVGSAGAGVTRAIRSGRDEKL